jgi:hypothetical protein
MRPLYVELKHLDAELHALSVSGLPPEDVRPLLKDVVPLAKEGR